MLYLIETSEPTSANDWADYIVICERHIVVAQERGFDGELMLPGATLGCQVCLEEENA